MVGQFGYDCRATAEIRLRLTAAGIQLGGFGIVSVGRCLLPRHDEVMGLGVVAGDLGIYRIEGPLLGLTTLRRSRCGSTGRYGHLTRKAEKEQDRGQHEDQRPDSRRQRHPTYRLVTLHLDARLPIFCCRPAVTL
ncbi:hypothetical protein A5711_04195 [Mycobacterium sp. E2238]|nr:hypothetical protein A5711_04195 [Mycobacterium sp. E2238]